MYLIHNGMFDDPIIRHKCNNPLCINPRHLIPGDYADNIQDMHDAERGIRLGIEIQECKRGHDLTVPYAIRIVKRKGRKDSRACRACESIRRDPHQNRVLTNVEQSDRIDNDST